MNDKANCNDSAFAQLIASTKMRETGCATGQYHVTCKNSRGDTVWSDVIDNLVVTEGKNAALDAFLSGSGYTTTGPYLGLISSVGFSAVSASDTAAQLNGSNGWKEAGISTFYPLYVGTRKTCAWSSASSGSKSLSSPLSFTIQTTGGTVKGCFVVFGAGASSAIGNTSGVLWSAGTFTNDKILSDGDVLQVSYSTSL
jgi:hypothetical protein